MAARWSAMVLLCQLLLAVGLAAALAAASTLSDPAVAVLSVAELCGVALLLSAAPLLLGLSSASVSVPRAEVGQLVRALCRDAVALEIALARMALEPWRASPDCAGPAARSAPRPVLLVHGFGCSCAVWRPLLARLRAAGIGPVRAVSLEPLFVDIERLAAQLLGELAALDARGGGNAITVVTHSMGGLIARAALRGARPGAIGRLITIGAPHHGTALACRFGWPNARQMCPRSSWLRQLNACQEDRLGIPITAVYSLDDNYIVPAGSARLKGARTLELRGVGHLGLLESGRVLEHVVSELLE